MKGRRNIIAALGLLAAALSLSACASPSHYYGIDLTPIEVQAQQYPQRAQSIRERNLIMLIAMIEGCYERTLGGFRPVRAVEARSFECAEKLAAVENRSAELGLGRSPSGIEAMSLPSLAQMARSGDKRAQLELGIRFEEGIGLPESPRNACKLYAQAASQSGGTIWIYVPPVGNGTTGRVMPLNQGPVIPGLSAAQDRLQSMREGQGC